MRAFALPSATLFERTVQAPIGALGFHSVFAHIAGGVAGLDLATGATLFTEKANVYDVSDGRLAIANSAGVALVRAVDASVAWRISSVGTSGIAFDGRKVAVLRRCRLIIFGSAAPPRGITRELPYRRCGGLRTIGQGFVFALDDFDGAWMGTAYHAIDLATGKSSWSRTDATLLGATASTVSLEAQGSVLPWAPLGWNATARLADGVTVSVVATATACDDVALHAAPYAAFLLCEHVRNAVDAFATLYRLCPRTLREPFARAVATFPLSRGDAVRRGFRWALVDGELAVLARGRLRFFDRAGGERLDLAIPCDDAVGDAGASAPPSFVAVRVGRALVVACRSMTEQRVFAFPDAAR